MAWHYIIVNSCRRATSHTGIAPGIEPSPPYLRTWPLVPGGARWLSDRRSVPACVETAAKLPAAEASAVPPSSHGMRPMQPAAGGCPTSRRLRGASRISVQQRQEASDDGHITPLQPAALSTGAAGVTVPSLGTHSAVVATARAAGCAATAATGVTATMTW